MCPVYLVVQCVDTLAKQVSIAMIYEAFACVHNPQQESLARCSELWQSATGHGFAWHLFLHIITKSRLLSIRIETAATWTVLDG